MRRFDLIVIGTGTTGSGVATRCRRAGKRVAIIDARPFGGTCALRGCDPKKILVGAAEATEWVARLESRGIRSDRVRIDWPDLMRFKRSMIDPVPRQREEAFAEAGIEAFRGRARFAGPAALEVNGERLEGRHVVIAAGAKQAALRMPGSEHVITSDQFLELAEIPGRVVFVGGGYVSFEFAHVAARAGARVTVLHRGSRPLRRFEPDLVDQLVTRTQAIGVDVQVETEVRSIEAVSGALRVQTSRGGHAGRLEADLVVHGAGRVPDVDDLGLEVAAVAWDPRRGVRVNEYLQSVSNPSVYAGGDAADSGGAPLTPVAGADARVIAANLLEGHQRTFDYSIVPSVVFTVPPLASVGLLEATARERQQRFSVKGQDTSGWFSSRRIGETCSGFKVLVEEGTGRILGAHLLGPGAEETINLFAMAMQAGMPAPALKDMLFAYPTQASNLPYMV